MKLFKIKKDRGSRIKVQLDGGAFMPERAHELDARYDLRTPETFFIEPGACATIDTGVHIEIPKGYVGFLKSKSGLNVKYGITGEGVIDSGYTGSIKAKLYCIGRRRQSVDRLRGSRPVQEIEKY